MRLGADQMMAKTLLVALPTGTLGIAAVTTTTTATKTTGTKTGG